LAALSAEWRTSPDVVGRAHMDERLFQATVTVLVLEGHPIVSGGSGYRLSDDPVEVAEAGGSLIHRGTEIIKRGRALVETAKTLRLRRAGITPPVQPSLF